MLAEYPPERAAAITGVPRARSSSGSPRRSARSRRLTICAGFGMQRYTNSGPDDAGDHRAARDHRQHRQAGRRLDVRQPADADLLGRSGTRSPSTRPSAPDGVGCGCRSPPPGSARDMLAHAATRRSAWPGSSAATRSRRTRRRTRCSTRSARSTSAWSSTSSSPTRRARPTSSCPPRRCSSRRDVIGAYWHPYIQLKQKVIEPPGEVKPEIGDLLAARAAARLRRAAMERARVPPGPTTPRSRRGSSARLAPFPGSRSSACARGRCLAPGTEEVAFADLRLPDAVGQDRAALRARRRARWGVDALPRFVAAGRVAVGRGLRRYPLLPLTPNTKNRIHSQFNNLPSIRQLAPGAGADASPPTTRAPAASPTATAPASSTTAAASSCPVRSTTASARAASWLTNGWWMQRGRRRQRALVRAARPTWATAPRSTTTWSRSRGRDGARGLHPRPQPLHRVRGVPDRLRASRTTSPRASTGARSHVQRAAPGRSLPCSTIRSRAITAPRRRASPAARPAPTRRTRRPVR